MRLYTVSGEARFRIDNVAVTNCTGTFGGGAFMIGYVDIGNPAAIASLSVSDCTLRAPVIFGVAENFGTIESKNVTFFPSHFDWGKRPVMHAGFCGPHPLPMVSIPGLVQI